MPGRGRPPKSESAGQVVRISPRSYETIRYVRDRYYQKHSLKIDLKAILDKIIDNAEINKLFDLED